MQPDRGQHLVRPLAANNRGAVVALDEVAKQFLRNLLVPPEAAIAPPRPARVDQNVVVLCLLDALNGARQRVRHQVAHQLVRARIAHLRVRNRCLLVGIERANQVQLAGGGRRCRRRQRQCVRRCHSTTSTGTARILAARRCGRHGRRGRSGRSGRRGRRGRRAQRLLEHRDVSCLHADRLHLALEALLVASRLLGSLAAQEVEIVEPLACEHIVV
mmetsp:Transcript_5499/g.18257  ORF Transcript_5499/g.18257 Transcript_5499/m.18257 type:complete len:216 (-) Transcript_5499:75-722(-)